VLLPDKFLWSGSNGYASIDRTYSIKMRSMCYTGVNAAFCSRLLPAGTFRPGGFMTGAWDMNGLNACI
jgi:hypothetical protein